MEKLKVGVLISGRGSNLQALIDACMDPAYPAEIVHVISNVHGAGGLERAEAAGISTSVVDHKDFPDRETFEAAVNDVLSIHGAELVCLAGFMRLLSEGFVHHWEERMINIHPSLLPSFKGLNVHERAIEAGVRFTGCTVHFVVPDMDAGPIIAQAAVPIHAGDDADRLAARILVEEHKLYPLAVKLIAEKRVRVEDGRVVIDDMAAPAQSLINPTN